jgi:hypothetical protein
MRRRRWPERSDRPARPKVQRLSAVERDNYLNAMMRTIERSPVLTALSFDVRILRGRFYVERACRDADGTLIGTETMGRITPLADAAASLYDQAERERPHQLCQDLAGEEKMSSLDVTNGNQNDAL